MGKDGYEKFEYDPIDIPGLNKSEKRYSWYDLEDVKDSVEFFYSNAEIERLTNIVNSYAMRDAAQERVLNSLSEEKEDTKQV